MSSVYVSSLLLCVRHVSSIGVQSLTASAFSGLAWAYMARHVSSAVFLALYYTVFAFKIDATVSRNMALVCVRSKEAMALTSLAAVTGTK